MAAQSYRGATSMARAPFIRGWRPLRDGCDALGTPCRIRLHGCRDLRFDAEIFCPKSRKTKGLQPMRSRGHESCVWSTNATPRPFLKGFFPNHGFDLVDHLGVRDRRLCGHAARLVTRTRTKGEAHRLRLCWDLVGIKHCAQGCPCPRMGVSNFPRLGQIVKGISSRSGTRPAEGLGGSSA